MRLFWRHGYEGVSISDLTGAIGIAPPSLYAAFGSKAALYRETLDRYVGLPGALSDLHDAQSLEGLAESVLRRGVEAVTDPEGEGGCMVSTGLIQCASEHADLASDLAERRRRMRDTLARAFGRWLDEEAAMGLARHLITVLQGLAIQARDGATRDDLEQVAHEVLQGLTARLKQGQPEPP